MECLTVFTPTYDRAYILSNCYTSLTRQTNTDFLWLIIDDGSSDNTKELVERWIAEEKVKIQYVYQENQGMHGAHNTAYELIETELNVCIDSDDYMPDDAVENIIRFWQTVKQNPNIAGIAALDAKKNGDIIGTRFPQELTCAHIFDLYHKHGILGDKKFVYRTNLTKQFPYPLFEGEKYVSLGYKYARIDLNHEMALLNKVLCIVDYLEDGSSLNMIRQYYKNPKGFAFIRKDNMTFPNTRLLYKYKECIHYVSSSLLSKTVGFIAQSPLKLLTILAVPPGLLLYLYIRVKNYNKT